ANRSVGRFYSTRSLEANRLISVISGYLCLPQFSLMFNKRIKIKELLSLEPNNQQVTVMGWVRTFRNNQFIALNDGSTNTNLQVVVELGKYGDVFVVADSYHYGKRCRRRTRNVPGNDTSS